jgi:hypothetical protein
LLLLDLLLLLLLLRVNVELMGLVRLVSPP